MQYYVTNGIHIAEVPVDDFKIVLVDKKKKSAATKNYANAGFFGKYKEGGAYFTLPVGNLICDMGTDEPLVNKYCGERGRIEGDKFYFNSYAFSYMNQFYHKVVSSLVIKDGSASIVDMGNLDYSLDYAIAGIPIMKDGEDVKFKTYVSSQGWDSSTLYGTWHVFLGLKSDKSVVYVMGMKTKTYNMILTAEAFKKFKAIGMVDVIKLDGGGSFHMNVDGKAVASTLENRQINTIITIGGLEKPLRQNPYQIPSITITYGCKNASAVKWMQWQLNFLGFYCGEVDGSFGPNTMKQLKAFQKSRCLDVDGSCGPATKAALLQPA